MRSPQAPAFESGEASFVVDEDLRIVSWNPAAVWLTGTSAEQAVGHPCWEVVRGTADDGSVVCSPDCPYMRRFREGRPVKSREIWIETARGPRRRVTLSTVEVRGGEAPLFLHLMHQAD